jgi:hypothetical protein
VVINPRNLALTRSHVQPPENYDLRLDIRELRTETGVFREPL